MLRRKRPSEGAPKTDSREVTRNDRVKFSQLVNQLSSEQLGQLVALIHRKSPEALNEVRMRLRAGPLVGAHACVRAVTLCALAAGG